MKDISEISEDEPAEYTMKEIAEKYNLLVKALKGAVSIVVAMLCLGAFSADPSGKAKLYNIKASQYVVTNEVDGVFKGWLTNDVFSVSNKTEVRFGVENPTNDFYINDITLGDIINNLIPKETDPEFYKEMKAAGKDGMVIGHLSGNTYRGGGVVIGIPTGDHPYIPGSKANPGYGTNTVEEIQQLPDNELPSGQYSYDFNGAAFAGNIATAYGAGAQARDQVSVAIGNRAIASGLHGPSGIAISIPTKRITKTFLASGETSVVTNTIPTDIDPAMWESFPYGSGRFELVETTTIDGVKTETWEEILKGVIDPRYATADEMEMYNFIFNPGQPNINYKDAIYGVAVGYRSVAAAFHTLALGHNARAYRPHSVAVGPTTHIKSEGSVGLGYLNTIEKNSPFCLAVGSNTSIDSGMTNAIVIGVPPVNFSRRFA